MCACLTSSLQNKPIILELVMSGSYIHFLCAICIGKLANE